MSNNRMPEWVTPFLIRVEDKTLGFVSEYLKTSNQRRHVIATIFALFQADRLITSDGERITDLWSVADPLRQQNTSHLGAMFFPDCFQDLIGILKKPDLPVQEPDFYITLYDWLRRGQRLEKIDALKKAKWFHKNTFWLLDTLDPIWVHPLIITAINTKHDLQQLQVGIRVWKALHPGITEPEIVRHFLQFCRSKFKATAYFVGLDMISSHLGFDLMATKTAQFPEPPFDFGRDLIPVRTPSELHSLGIQMRNCLNDCLLHVFKRERYFYRLPKKLVVVAIERDEPIGWRISEIRAEKNDEPDEYDLEFIKTTLTKHGVFDGPRWGDNPNYFD